MSYSMLQLIGDELFFDRQLVAMLTTGATPTVQQAFRDLIEFGEDPEDVPIVKEQADDYVQALEDLGIGAKEFAKGGLLRMTDLAIIIDRLKEG